MKELLSDLKNVESEIKDAVINNIDDVKPVAVNEPIDDMDERRRELIQSSEGGELEKSGKYLQKTSAKVINKIYKEVESKRLEKANVFVTDVIISRFADTLGGCTQ